MLEEALNRDREGAGELEEGLGAGDALPSLQLAHSRAVQR
jgi:hypothetical protein